MKKVVGLGACVLDTLINCDKYPVEDTKQRATGVFLAGGGPVGNALVVMSKLGVSTEIVGAFAKDNAGDYLLSDFKKYGVGTDFAIQLVDKSSFTSYIVLSENSATRTCVFDRGTVPDDENNVNLSVLDGCDVVHLDGNYLNSAIYLAKNAKNKGIKVSLDAGGLYDGIEKLLPYVDILIPSCEFATGITKTDNAIDAMKILNDKYSPEILVVTDGKNGGYYLDGCDIKHYESLKLEKVVDTNGAGDTFHGAFISAYCDGKSVVDCCNFASKVAGYKCMNKGVRTFELSKDIINNLKV